jgi:OOP family OmpA-OmpF porin
MKKYLLAAAMAAGCATAFAQNAPSPVYFALGAGPSHLNYDCTDATACRNKDIGYKLVGGYRLNRNLAVELAYVNYGKTTAHVTSPSEYDTNTDVAGWQAGVAYSVPFGRSFQATGRAGLAYNRTAFGAQSDSASYFKANSKAALYLGAGVSYRLHDSASLFADLDLSSADDGVNGAFGVRLLSAGVKLDF